MEHPVSHEEHLTNCSLEVNPSTKRCKPNFLERRLIQDGMETLIRFRNKFDRLELCYPDLNE